MKSKEERLLERKQLKDIDLFSNEVNIEDFEKYLKQLIDSYTSEELIEELIKCGIKEENN